MSVAETQECTRGEWLLVFCMGLVIGCLFVVLLCEGYTLAPGFCHCGGVGNPWTSIGRSGEYIGPSYDEVPVRRARQLTWWEIGIKGFAVLLGLVVVHGGYWLAHHNHGKLVVKGIWWDWLWVTVAMIVSAMILAMPHMPRKPKVTCVEYHRSWITSDQIPSHLNGEVS